MRRLFRREPANRHEAPAPSAITRLPFEHICIDTIRHDSNNILGTANVGCPFRQIPRSDDDAIELRKQTFVFPKNPRKFHQAQIVEAMELHAHLAPGGLRDRRNREGEVPVFHENPFALVAQQDVPGRGHALLAQSEPGPGPGKGHQPVNFPFEDILGRCTSGEQNAIDQVTFRKSPETQRHRRAWRQVFDMGADEGFR